MDARRRDRFGDVHLGIDHVEDDLQHHGDDAAAAVRAGDEEHRPSQETMSATSRRAGACRDRRIRIAADEAESVRRTGLGGEIVELVVEQNAGPFGDKGEPIEKVERVGVGDGIAF